MAVLEPAPSIAIGPEIDEAEAKVGARGRRWRGNLGT